MWESVDVHCSGQVNEAEFIDWWRVASQQGGQKHGQHSNTLATALGAIFRTFAHTRQQMLRRYRRRRWRVKLVVLWLIVVTDVWRHTRLVLFCGRRAAARQEARHAGRCTGRD